MWPFNRKKKASNDMSVIQDLEKDFESIKAKVESAVKTGESDYEKLAANPEVKAVADVLLSVAEAELPAGVVSAAGEVFKTILQVGRDLGASAVTPPATAPVPSADPAVAPSGQPVASPAAVPAAGQSPVAAPPSDVPVNPAATSDPAAAMRAATEQSK